MKNFESYSACAFYNSTPFCGVYRAYIGSCSDDFSGVVIRYVRASI